MLKALLLHLTLFALIFQIQAQNEPHAKCGHDLLMNQKAAADPAYAQEVLDYKAQVPEVVAQAQNRSNPVYVIPVVVHVIHSGQAIGQGANLSDTRIQSQIDILNQDFRRTNTDTNETPSDFVSVAGDAQVEFCLASFDPSGNGTTGIIRHQYNNIDDIDFIESTIKPSTSWDSDRYLNIWTVDLPSANVIGYSFLPTPTMVGSIQDGVVITYDRFGFVTTNNRGRTTTHEVGHYLGLSHIWGGADSNGDPIGCLDDDGIEDTPDQGMPYYNCPNTGNSCFTDDMFMNYMDYTDDYCMNLFTVGQAAVMQNILGGIRSELAENGVTSCSGQCYDLEFGNFTTGFEATDPINGWITEDNNADQTTWFFNSGTNDTNDWGPNNGQGYAVYYWNNDNLVAADDYLFTPCFKIQAGHSYSVSFTYACASAGGTVYPERFEIGFSGSQSAADFNVIDNNWTFDPVNNAYPNYNNADLTFNSPINGTTSIGFHVFSDADQYALQIDDFQIQDLGDNVANENLLEVSRFDLSPNPANESVWVTVDFEQSQKEVVIELYDMLGRSLISRRIDNTTRFQEEIATSHLEKGIYFVTIVSEGKWQTQKLVIAH